MTWPAAGKDKFMKKQTDKQNINVGSSAPVASDGHKQQDVARLELEIADWKAKYLRALADYQNLEKRIFTRREEESKLAAAKTIAKMLTVLDNLEKATDHLQDQGLVLAVQLFKEVLASEAVEKIEVMGKKYDPLTMECIEVTDNSADDVVEEVQSGYTMHGKLIRPAKVKVGKLKIN
jgi:molecular chaperone GrpE